MQQHLGACKLAHPALIAAGAGGTVQVVLGAGVLPLRLSRTCRDDLRQHTGGGVVDGLGGVPLGAAPAVLEVGAQRGVEFAAGATLGHRLAVRAHSPRQTQGCADPPDQRAKDDAEQQQEQDEQRERQLDPHRGEDELDDALLRLCEHRDADRDAEQRDHPKQCAHAQPCRSKVRRVWRRASRLAAICGGSTGVVPGRNWPICCSAARTSGARSLK